MRKPTQNEIDNFITYRANHVALVQKLGKLVFGLDFSDHDSDKIDAVGRDLELFALRQASKNGKLKISSEDKDTLRKVSGKHALSSKHHIEYWDPKITLKTFDENDNNFLNGHSMPDRWIKEMLCDWTACCLYHNEGVFEWYNKTCTGDNPRFDFTDRQKELIVNSLELIQKAIKKEHLSYPGITYSTKQVEPLKESKEDNFKKWFGKSKVVNKDGSPKIVYHGSTENFEEFYDYSYFTDDYTNADGYASGEYVYECYLRIEHPLIIDCNGDKWDNLLINGKRTSTQEVSKTLDTSKYDGIIFENINDFWIDDEDYGDTGNVYLVVNPNQIKSVDNNGNFSLESNNIYEKLEKREGEDYYRIVVKDPEHQMSNGELGLFTGTGAIVNNIYDWDEDEEEADEIHDELNSILNKLENRLPLPNLDKNLKLKFAYKKFAFNHVFDLLDELDDIMRNLDMGFYLDYEPVNPEKIVYEDDYQIAYLPDNSKKITESKDLTQTENFKKWFGKSVVKEPSGKPLVVYHGSLTDEEIEIFDPNYYANGTTGTIGTYFTDNYTAAFRYTGDEGDQSEDRIYDCYLRIENPLVIECEEDTTWDNILFEGENKTTDDILKIAKQRGNDGVIIKNIIEGAYEYPITDYVVFESNQIKSASFNNGEYSMDNDNIYESKSGTPVFVVTDYEGRIVPNTKNTDINIVKEIRNLLAKKYSSIFRITKLNTTIESKESPYKLEEDDGGCCGGENSINASSSFEGFAPENNRKIIDPSGQLLESNGKSAAFCFGRFGIPQYGYIKLWKKLASLPTDDRLIYTSHSYDKKKNPIPYETKSAVIKYLLKEYNINANFVDSESRTIIEVVVDLFNKGYNRITFVGGSDRVEDVTNLLKKYNDIPDKQGRAYHFDSIDGASGGDRDPDSDSVEGMSGTKMRQFILDGDFESFKNACPIKDAHILKSIYEEAKKFMES